MLIICRISGSGSDAPTLPHSAPLRLSWVTPPSVAIQLNSGVTQGATGVTLSGVLALNFYPCPNRPAGAVKYELSSFYTTSPLKADFCHSTDKYKNHTASTEVKNKNKSVKSCTARYLTTSDRKQSNYSQ